MSEHDATVLADQIIGKVLTHQVNVIGENRLCAEASAREAAKGLAAFRQTLIDELKKQTQ